MIGKRKSQPDLFDVGNVYPLALKPGSFHAQLAQAAPRLFRDEDFAGIYAKTMGRPSVPPSQLALALLLQHEAGVSDEEAVARTGFDLRWAAVLGRHAGEPLCAKSTLQLFRSHLVLHDAARAVFLASIREAKRSGLLKGAALRLAIDTKPVSGRGAVLDTYNLVAQAIRQAAAALAKEARQKPDGWLRSQDLARYTEPSVKGAADLDWADKEAASRLLSELVADARRVLALCQGAGEAASKAAELLGAILLQDVEPTGAATDSDAVVQERIKEGTAQGRIPSASDPEQRHGRKSASRRFTGHKASITTDIDSQLITSVDVLSGDAPDACGALKLVEQAQANTGMVVEETLGDCAYGSADTRGEFAEAGRVLLAKTPGEADRGLFAKSAFVIDHEHGCVMCPEGHATSTFVSDGKGARIYQFGAVCSGCPLREYCTRSVKGRSLRVHPMEAQLAQARAYQQSPPGKAHMRQRVVVEHRLARLGQLGIGQARYMGRAKTLFQLTVAATIANLRLIWNREADSTRPPTDCLLSWAFRAIKSRLWAYLSAPLRWMQRTGYKRHRLTCAFAIANLNTIFRPDF